MKFHVILLINEDNSAVSNEVMILTIDARTAFRYFDTEGGSRTPAQMARRQMLHRESILTTLKQGLPTLDPTKRFMLEMQN